MSLSFNDLTDAPWSHCILGRQSEFVPRATLQVLQAVWTLAGADGKTAPLLTVIFWVLQNVTCEEEKDMTQYIWSELSPNKFDIFPVINSKLVFLPF